MVKHFISANKNVSLWLVTYLIRSKRERERERTRLCTGFPPIESFLYEICRAFMYFRFDHFVECIFKICRPLAAFQVVEPLTEVLLSEKENPFHVYFDFSTILTLPVEK